MNIPQAEKEIHKILTQLVCTTVEVTLSKLGIKVEENDSNDLHPPKGQGPEDICPECGNQIVMQEGCKKCITCSWSKC